MYSCTMMYNSYVLVSYFYLRLHRHRPHLFRLLYPKSQNCLAQELQYFMILSALGLALIIKAPCSYFLFLLHQSSIISCQANAWCHPLNSFPLRIYLRRVSSFSLIVYLALTFVFYLALTNKDIFSISIYVPTFQSCLVSYVILFGLSKRPECND